MTDPAQDLGALLLAVGQLQGKVGEIAHGQNDMRQKVDGIAEKLFTAPTRDDFEKLGARVTVLEAAKNTDDGAKSVLAAIMQSKAFGAFVTALLSVVAALIAVKEGLVK